ncbi:MAG: glycosyltransferase, partial [Terriglobales bacterium]
MKVLHVINSLILAGVEVLLTEMVPHFQARGLEVEIAVLKPLDSPLEERLRSSGVPFLPNRTARIYSPAHVFSLARHLHKYDVVQANLFPAQLWVAAAAALAGATVPLVTTEQNTHNDRRHWWFHPLDRWMYGRYRAIACCSPETQDALVQWIPQVKPRVSVIPNGVPLERFENAQPLPRANVLPEDRSPIIMFVARLQPQKDHVTLLRALAKIPRARLALVGDGELRPSLEALAASLGIWERVHFLGRRADVPQLLKLADVYVHSSHWEGFGIAAVEAMAAGLPVIASDVPGLSQVVGSAGLLFPRGDADCLAGHISS